MPHDADQEQFAVGAFIFVEFFVEGPYHSGRRGFRGEILEVLRGCGSSCRYKVLFQSDGKTVLVDPATHRVRRAGGPPEPPVSGAGVTTCSGSKGQPSASKRRSNIHGATATPLHGPAGETVELCPICQENPANGTVLCTLQRCAHTFCRKCIEMWWATADRKSCPVCRVGYAGLRGVTFSTVGTRARAPALPSAGSRASACGAPRQKRKGESDGGGPEQKRGLQIGSESKQGNKQSKQGSLGSPGGPRLADTADYKPEDFVTPMPENPNPKGFKPRKTLCLEQSWSGNPERLPRG